MATLEMRGRAPRWSARPTARTHALCTHAHTSDKMDAPAGCATLSATRPFHFVHTAGCCNAKAKC